MIYKTHNKKVGVGYVSLIIAGITFGTIPVLSALLRDKGISSLEQTFIRLAIGAIFGLFGVIFYLNRQQKEFINQCFNKKVQSTFFIQGIFFFAMILAYLSSVALNTPVGEAALLVQIHPVFTLILGWLFLKEIIAKEKLVALTLAILGLIILTRPWEWTSFLSSIVGDFLALLNGFFYALYLLSGKAMSETRERISPFVSIAFVMVYSFVISLPFIIFLPSFTLPSSLVHFSLLSFTTIDIIILGTLLALFGSIIPYSLIMVSTKYNIESSRASILLLCEPISAIILGFVLLSESITIYYIIGGFAILAAIVIVVLTNQKD